MRTLESLCRVILKKLHPYVLHAKICLCSFDVVGNAWRENSCCPPLVEAAEEKLRFLFVFDCPALLDWDSHCMLHREDRG